MPNTNPQPRYRRTGFLPFDVIDLDAQDVLAQSIVKSVAELVALPSDMPDGAEILVLSLDDAFVLLRDSTLPADPMVIIPAKGGGNWARRFRPSMRWAHQVVWEYDSVNGDDENDGTSNVPGADFVGPVKTTDEICRRLNRVKLPAFNFFSYLVNLNSPVPDTDRVVFSSLTNPGGTGSNGDIFDTLTFVGGDPTVLFTGTFAAVTPGASGPAGGTRASFDGGVGFVAANFVGKRVSVTSGAASGSRTWVGKSLGGQVAQCGQFIDPIALPAPGDTFEILELPAFAAGLKFCDASSGQIVLVGVDITPDHDIVNRMGQVTLIGCHVGNVTFCDFGGADFDLFDCCVESPIGVLFNPVGRMQIGGCVVLSFVQNLESSEMEISNSTIIGGIVSQGDLSFDLHEPPGEKLRITRFNPADTGVSIWDAPVAAGSDGALSLGRGAYCYVCAPLYGANPLAAAGAFVSSGSTLLIRDDFTPTVTGVADIQIDANDAIPTINPANGVPVAGAAVVNWIGAGGWADAASYNRNAHNLKNGTRIITCA